MSALRMSVRWRRRARSRVVVMVALGVTACLEAPFEHSNPLDEHNEGNYWVVGGPDTIRTSLETYTLELQSDPPLDPGLRVSWSSRSPLLQQVFNDRIFRGLPTLIPTVANAAAHLGSNVILREFVLLQRVGDLTLGCSVGPCAGVPSLGREFSFGVGGTSDAGEPLGRLSSALARATVVPRVSGLVEILALDGTNRVKFRSSANGSGWVVVTLDGVADSMFVSVRQRAATWSNVCPASVQVGETVMLGTASQVDANEHPVVTPDDGIQWFGVDTDGPGFATIQADGTLMGSVAGTWIARSINPAVPGHFDDCEIVIVDP